MLSALNEFIKHTAHSQQLLSSCCVLSRSRLLYGLKIRPESKSPCYYNLFPNALCISSAKSKRNSRFFSNNQLFHGVQQPCSEDRALLSDDIARQTDIESLVRQTRQTFGDTLPKDYLSKEEYQVYERLFGPPLRETTTDDLEILPTNDDLVVQREQSVLLRENDDGNFEEVEYDLLSDKPSDEISFSLDPNDIIEHRKDCVDESLSTESRKSDFTLSTDKNLQIQYVANSQREMKVMAQLHKDMISEVEQSKKIGAEKKDFPEEAIEEELEEGQEATERQFEEPADDLYTSSDTNRTHPHTIAGRSRSNPSTLCLPNQQLVTPISELLTRTNSTHLQLAAEKAFGGKGLPFSVSVPSSMKNLPQREIGLSATQRRMSEIEADAYISAVLPGAYISILSVLVEVRKRLGQSWLRKLLLKEDECGPSVLDAGAGGAGIIAWRKIMEAEWDIMKDEGIVKGDFTPLGKSTVVTGSDCLRYRASKLLENTTFLPRLPDYIHATQNDGNIDGGLSNERKMYNIVIAPYLLLAEKENFKRKNLVKNLWTLVNPKGGILIIMEKGLPRGFEAVAEARSFILKSYIASPGSRYVENDLDCHESEQSRFEEKEEGMIIAPCTSYSTCPMYLHPGTSSGRKDFCHFPQRYIRPPFLQKLLEAKSRNHEDVKFSYIAIRRGIDSRKNFTELLTGDEATTQSFGGYESHYISGSHQGENYMKSDVKFNTLSLPRVILPPLKRHGHVILDLCTPSGQLERWTIPKSFSKVAYRDARKSKWGDLWALGAKTRVVKNMRLGKVVDAKAQSNINSAMEKKRKVNKYDIIIGDDGFKRFQRAGKVFVDRNERRTKAGRLFKGPKPLGLDL